MRAGAVFGAARRRRRPAPVGSRRSAADRRVVDLDVRARNDVVPWIAVARDAELPRPEYLVLGEGITQKPLGPRETSAAFGVGTVHGGAIRVPAIGQDKKMQGGEEKCPHDRETLSINKTGLGQKIVPLLGNNGIIQKGHSLPGPMCSAAGGFRSRPRTEH